jgi:hypothetical protein
MKLDVLVEKIGENGYRATWPGPWQESAEGPTREEALSRLREKINERLRQTNAEVVALDLGPGPHPFARWAGTWDPNDPRVQEYLRCVEEYRREREAEFDAP